MDKLEGAGAATKLLHEELTEKIIGAAIEVHGTIGPGLSESVYEECLCREMTLRGLKFQRQMLVPVIYKGIEIDCKYRLDLLVENLVVLELKTVDRVLPIHEAQLLTYMRQPVGLIINFKVPALRHGIVRRVL